MISPLTLNHDWLLKNLERLHVGLDQDGTAIGSAIGTAVNRVKDLESESKVVILITDGTNNRGEISPQIAAEVAADLRGKSLHYRNRP